MPIFFLPYIIPQYLEYGNSFIQIFARKKAALSSAAIYYISSKSFETAFPVEELPDDELELLLLFDDDELDPLLFDDEELPDELLDDEAFELLLDDEELLFDDELLELLLLFDDELELLSDEDD